MNKDSFNSLLISSNDFAEISNLDYSNRVAYDKNLLKRYDLEIIEISENPNFHCITYKRTHFDIGDNTLIFCNTSMIDNLFYHLKSLKKLSNITLITHQTDQLITKDIFDKRPDSIKKWYSVNVGYSHEDLIPIPIGIASDFSLKNLNRNDFLRLKNSTYKKNEINMYLNFQINTNFKERYELFKYFEDESWVTIDEPNLSKLEYRNNIINSSFVICPWGNGIDTHRFWETLYLGSIPITKNHITYQAAKHLPVLFVEDYKDINFELLQNFMHSLDVENINLESLYFPYWKNIIIKKNTENYTYKITEKKATLYFFKIKRFVFKKYLKVLKFFKTLKNKIIKKTKAL